MKLFLILSSVLLNCAAQLLIRQGMLKIGALDWAQMSKQLSAMLANGALWGAMICYAISIFLWMAALAKAEVSYAVPFQSVSFVIVAFAGYYLFHEPVSLLRILGIAIIVAGVLIVSRS